MHLNGLRAASFAYFFLLLNGSPAEAGHFRDFAPAPSAGSVRSRSCGAELVTKSASLGAPTRHGPRAKKLDVDPRTRIQKIFDALLVVVNEKEAEIRALLSGFNSYHGTQFELAQVRAMLKHGYLVEGWHLENTRQLDSAAVYGSTNVPLYTFIAHGVIPSMLAKDVWFRTPETTRALYLAFYKLFAEALPPGMISGLHMLHEAQDVQYDNFAKFFVLGTNRKGTAYRQPPADLVVFTGNPDTARKILARSEDKLKERPAIFPSFDQLFLGFGAGMNPFVVTPSAVQELEAVADQMLLPAKMNAAQDCMVPNFYVVHRSLLPLLKPILKRKVAAMRFGSNVDPEAGYTALELTKDFSRLEAYAAKYQKNLLNPDAVIDREKRSVSPHLFFFESGDFDDLLLQEHYGPFFSIISYDTVEDITKIARDHRVQAQAMYAIVYGSSIADAHTNEVERIFQQNRHAVVTNDSLFLPETSNMPFGGLGYKSSIIHTTRKSADGRIVTNTGHHPALVSTEAFMYFGLTSMPERQPLRTPQENRATLAEMLRLADGDPNAIPDMPAEWKAMNDPLMANRQTGIRYLREVIAREGLFRVMPDGYRPGAAAHWEQFFGSKLVFPSGTGARDARWGTGVAIHPSSVGSTVEALNQFRGRVNPHLGRGYLLGMFDNNKKREAQLVNAVKPGMMAHTEGYEDLARAGRLAADLPALKARAMKAIDAIVEKGSEDSARREELRLALEAWILRLFHSVQENFPEGAFFKNFGEFATADLGTQVTSFGSNYRHVVAQFSRRLFAATLHGQGKKYDSAAFQQHMGEDPWEMSTRFINTLLVHSENLLVQGRVPIARTELGFPMEFRVDFMDGEAISSKLRFSHEYLPEEAAEAAKQLNALFAAMPPEMRHLSGGADIARLTNGSWVIIEFNFGANSGTMWPQYFPVDANQFISNLTGQPTHFLASLETVFAGGLGAQRTYLQSIAIEKELWWKAKLSDFSRVEAARWFRNRILDDFRNGEPNQERAEAALAHLKALFEGMASGENEDFDKLYAGAENYLRRRLVLTPVVRAPLGGAVPKSLSLGTPRSGTRSSATPTEAPVNATPLATRAIGADVRRLPTELNSDRHDVPGWPYQWMRVDEDLPPALLIQAFLKPAAEAVIRSGASSEAINEALDALFQVGQRTVDTFRTNDEHRYEPIPVVRRILSELRTAGLPEALKKSGFTW